MPHATCFDREVQKNLNYGIFLQKVGFRNIFSEWNYLEPQYMGRNVCLNDTNIVFSCNFGPKLWDRGPCYI